MINQFKLQCRLDIEATIDVPLKGFFIRNERSARLCYRMGKELKYINIATPMDMAELLKKQGMIHFYCINGEVIKMFEKVLITITGAKGEPIQQRRLVELKWEEISLSPSQVQTIAADHELKNNSFVKDFISKVFSAAS